MAVALQKIRSPSVRKRMIVLLEEIAGQDMAVADGAPDNDRQDDSLKALEAKP